MTSIVLTDLFYVYLRSFSWQNEIINYQAKKVRQKSKQRNVETVTNFMLHVFPIPHVQKCCHFIFNQQTFTIMFVPTSHFSMGYFSIITIINSHSFSSFRFKLKSLAMRHRTPIIVTWNWRQISTEPKHIFFLLPKQNGHFCKRNKKKIHKLCGELFIFSVIRINK